MTLEIFLPYWGEPSLLFETVDSVRRQQDGDWRLTIIDDCYPDLTVRDAFLDEPDERITYRRNEVNLGITGNFREAVRLAQGTHMAILGSDDLLQPNYVDTVKRTLDLVAHADVVQVGVDVIDERGVRVRPLVDRVKQDVLAPKPGPGRIAVLSGERMATSLIRGDWLYWPSLVFSTKRLKTTPFRDGFPIIQDLGLLMDIAFDGGTLAYNPITAFSYRRHSASASQETLVDGSRFRDEREYYALAAQLAGRRGWQRTARTARWRMMSRLHAVAELPHLVRANRAGAASALTHAFGVTTRRGSRRA